MFPHETTVAILCFDLIGKGRSFVSVAVILRTAFVPISPEWSIGKKKYKTGVFVLLSW